MHRDNNPSPKAYLRRTASNDPEEYKINTEANGRNNVSTRLRWEIERTKCEEMCMKRSIQHQKPSDDSVRGIVKKREIDMEAK